MLFSALALLLCQEPSLRWSRDVDELFWQALHQLEVEERAEDAAATLASLLDEPSVQQYRGQTGYLLAQQYRALRAAGLMEEAEALLPSIRRDIANTDMAQLAESVITLANRTHPGQDGANEELLELLLSAAGRNDTYLRSVMRGYGDRIVPELLMIFDRPEDYFAKVSTPGHHPALKRLWQQAWSSDLGGFLDAMASRIRIRSEDYFLALPIVLYGGGEAMEHQRDFMLKLSLDARPAIAEKAMLGLLSHVGDSACSARLSEILNEGSFLSPFILDLALSGANAQDFVPRYPVIVAALDSNNELIRSAARSLVMERNIAVGLYYLAESSDDLVARNRLLGSVFSRNDKRDVAPEQLQTTATPERVIRLAYPEGSTGEVVLPTLDGESRHGLPKSWSAWRESFENSPSSETRELALIAALRRGEVDFALRLLEKDGAPAELPSLIRLQELRDYPVLADFLLDYLGDNEQAVRAWNLLIQDRVATAKLRVEHYQWAYSEFGEEWNGAPHLGAREYFEGDESEWYDRLLSIMTHEGLPVDLRAYAARMGCTDFEEDPKLCIRFCRATLDAIPGDNSWNMRSPSLVAVSLGLRSIMNSRGVESIHDEWDLLFGEFANVVFRQPAPDRLDRSDSRYRDFSNLAYAAAEAGLSVRPFLDRALLSPNWLALDQHENSRFLRLAVIQGPEFFSKWVRVCGESNVKVSWPHILGSTGDSHYLIRETEPLVAELSAGLAAGNPEFEHDVWYSVIGQMSRQGGLLNTEVMGVLDGQISKYLELPHTASSVLYYAVSRGLGVVEFIDAARKAWAMEDLEDRDRLLRLVSSRYTPELVSLLLDAQVSHSSSLARIADEALARYARIRDARSGWAAWERQGRDGSPIDALVAKTAADKSKVVRIAAIQSLGTLEAKEALPFLVELLEDSDQEIVAAVQAALTRIHAAAEGSDE